MNIEKEQFPDSIDGRLEFAMRQRLGEIAARSRQRVRELSVELPRATGIERERIYAEMELERWMADGCQDDLL